MQLGADFAAELAKRIGGAGQVAALLPGKEGVEGAVEAREPLPAWAVALVEGMTAGTWKAVKAELLGA